VQQQNLKEITMNRFRAVTLLSVCVFLADLGVAQSPTPDTATEATPVQHAVASQSGKPITDEWHFKKSAGSANVTINSDGTCLFSGTYRDKKPGKDLDIAMAVKSSTGALMVFHYVGDASNGAQWSKECKSDILKDDFSTFADDHNWTGEYRLSLSAEGKAKIYEEQEKKKEELKKEEAEARKRHDEKLEAEKKAELAKEERREREEAEQAAQQAAQQHSSGSSIGSTISGIASTVGDVVSTISSVGTAIASLF